MLLFKRKWPVVMIILFAAAGARAAETWPARFDAGEDSLEARIKFPETRGDGTIIIRCAAQVSDSGKMEKHGCYGDNSGADVFIAAINKAAKKARMQPAVIDGRPHAVYVQYRVRFETRGDENILTIYNNPGVLENIEAYGEDHIAAQRGPDERAVAERLPAATAFSRLGQGARCAQRRSEQHRYCIQRRSAYYAKMRRGDHCHDEGEQFYARPGRRRTGAIDVC
ncbi:MAG: hypothetical protein U5K38_10355 [Woeseiaceae bacterium]|nr:hypothetical protein [Woeseiaceae bacterium]